MKSKVVGAPHLVFKLALDKETFADFEHSCLGSHASDTGYVLTWSLSCAENDAGVTGPSLASTHLTLLHTAASALFDLRIFLALPAELKYWALIPLLPKVSPYD